MHTAAKVTELSTRNLRIPDAWESQEERDVLESRELCPDQSHAKIISVIYNIFLEISVSNFHSGRTCFILIAPELLTVQFELHKYRRGKSKSKMVNSG